MRTNDKSLKYKTWIRILFIVEYYYIILLKHKKSYFLKKQF